MKQGRFLAALLALTIGCGLALDAPAARADEGAKTRATRTASTRETTKPAKRSGTSLRQFTGWVTAIDKSSLTVEKRGKTPRTMTFVKHDEMRTQGEIEKDSRVTVYYREEGDRAVAHRVVAKMATSSKNRG